MPAWHSKQNDAGCACGRYLQRVHRRMDDRDQLHRIPAARSSVARQHSRARARARPGPKSRPHPLHQPPRHASATTRKGTRALYRPRRPTCGGEGALRHLRHKADGRSKHGRAVKEMRHLAALAATCSAEQFTLDARWRIKHNACNQPRDSTLIPVDINSRAGPASASHTRGGATACSVGLASCGMRRIGSNH